VVGSSEIYRTSDFCDFVPAGLPVKVYYFITLYSHFMVAKELYTSDLDNSIMWCWRCSLRVVISLSFKVQAGNMTNLRPPKFDCLRGSLLKVAFTHREERVARGFTNTLVESGCSDALRDAEETMM
jgi:hypothetical protein